MNCSFQKISDHGYPGNQGYPAGNDLTLVITTLPVSFRVERYGNHDITGIKR